MFLSAQQSNEAMFKYNHVIANMITVLIRDNYSNMIKPIVEELYVTAHEENENNLELLTGILMLFTDGHLIIDSTDTYARHNALHWQKSPLSSGHCEEHRNYPTAFDWAIGLLATERKRSVDHQPHS